MRAYVAPFALAMLGACTSGTEALPSPRDLDKETAPSGGEKAPPGKDGKPPVDEPSSGATSISASLRPRLQWKRFAAFEADLASALELAPEALCSEFGSDSCIRGVHLVPLGGHEPFSTGLLEPAAEPLATTPTVVERVVLSACNQRVELDRQAGSDARVFKFALEGDAPAADSSAVGELATTLYRRFMARDPEQVERSTLGELTVDDAGKPVSASDFAKLACFVVGSASEFLFF